MTRRRKAAYSSFSTTRVRRFGVKGLLTPDVRSAGRAMIRASAPSRGASGTGDRFGAGFSPGAQGAGGPVRPRREFRTRGRAGMALAALGMPGSPVCFVRRGMVLAGRAGDGRPRARRLACQVVV